MGKLFVFLVPLPGCDALHFIGSIMRDRPEDEGTSYWGESAGSRAQNTARVTATSTYASKTLSTLEDEGRAGTALTVKPLEAASSFGNFVFATPK